MNRTIFIWCLGWLVALSAPGRAESLESIRQALKVAEAKLACCLAGVPEFLAAMGPKVSDASLKESQSAWEKYRDAELAFEMLGLSQDTDEGKEAHATILLRLTRERIE